MAGRTVAVLTHWLDPTADHVIEELNRRRVPVFRFDTAEFPERLDVSALLGIDGWSGALRTARREVRLDEVAGIYYRRPSDFELSGDMSDPERRWARAEARLGFGGLLSSLPGWLNHPSRIAEAEFKPRQLAAARMAGLRVPETIVTNDPREAKRFAESLRKVIYKPFSAAGISEAGRHRMLYTTLVPEQDWGDPAIHRTMHLFQEWIEHEHAVRLTVVDGRCFPAMIKAGSAAAHIDWRSDYEALSYEVTEVPAEVRLKVQNLMNELGLRFGALDLLVTPEGEWIFLEINPNGQWAWIEEQTRLPIASAIADALTQGAAA